MNTKGNTEQFHLGVYLGHDAGVSVLNQYGHPVFIGEESKFCGYKRPVFHPTLSLEHLKELKIDKFDSLSWAFMQESPEGCYWSDFFRYLEGIQPGVRAYLSSFCQWDTEFFFDHHISHAAGAFLPSGFERSIVLVVDGSGEDESLSVYLADRKSRPVFRKVLSLRTETFSFGHAYAEATRVIGYTKGPPDNHTGKMMGLSSFGRPRHLATLRSSLRGDPGLFPKMFDEPSEWHLLLSKMAGEDIKHLHEGFSPGQADLAASMQRFLEDELLALVSRLAGQYPEYRNLCLSGGVAQNSLMTGRIFAQRIFDDIFSSPVASDTGLAYGATAMAAYERSDKNNTQSFTWKTAYHGYKHDDIKAELSDVVGMYQLPISIDEDAFDPATIADMLIDNKIVVLFQGAQEVGPRALGNRSILSMPTTEMRDQINNTIKFREPWRPFAPVLLEESLPELFDETRPEPFMSIIYDTPAASQSKIPGVNHFDNTTRLQTVSATQNPRLHAIVSAVADKGHPPILLNTSYNVDGQTIVRTVWDAILTALVSGVDALVLEQDIVRSTLPERAPRAWLTVFDRILEPIFRKASVVNLVSVCDGKSAERFLSNLRGLPCVSMRSKELDVRLVDPQEFADSNPAIEDGSVTLVWFGDRQIMESEDFVVTGKFRSGYGASPFNGFEAVFERLKTSSDSEKILLLEASGLVMDKGYYLRTVENRVNPYEINLTDDLKQIRRDMHWQLAKKDDEINELKGTIEILRENIMNVLHERDAYKKALKDEG